MLAFHNTLSGRTETFTPMQPPKVTMYCCGPTVHDYAHIGNFRTFVFVDILNRYLRYRGYDLLFVMNVTDIDDQIIGKSTVAGVSLAEFTEKFTRVFFEDFDTLRIRKADIICKATEHIPEMIDLVQALLDNGLAYESDGSIYYKISGFKDYGKLSKKDFSGIRAGTRVDTDKYDKEDALDFVLWKGKRAGEPGWETSFGEGRPGWHLECSAMSMKYCGETLDIHCGGADLVFPHHENEIAQSEGATGKPFVRYWLHGEYLIVDGEKMSKSKGNYYTLRDLMEKGYHPSAIRYLLFSTHYRKQLNFTEEGLKQARAALGRITDFVETYTRGKYPEGENPEIADICAKALKQFETALDDDLNTSAAQAALFDFIREINRQKEKDAIYASDQDRILGVIREMDSVFDILPLVDDDQGLEDEILKLIEEREEARKQRDWTAADAVRDRLKEMGIELKDTPDGTVWKRV